MTRPLVYLGAAFTLLCAQTPVLAGPVAFVTYPFTVTGLSGPLDGVIAPGSLTFSTSLSPPGGGFVYGTNLLTALDFSWDGIAYDASTANTGTMLFGSSGQFVDVLFGTDCAPGVCTLNPSTEAWAAVVAVGASGYFGYAVPSSEVTYRGYVSAGVPTCTDANGNAESCPSTVSTPEPGTLALLGVGLAGIGLTRKRIRERKTNAFSRNAG